MKKYFKELFFIFAITFVFMVNCTTTPKIFPHYITSVKIGEVNEWVAENISEPNYTGTIYNQFIPLSKRIAAIIIVGKINNMLVAQAQVTIHDFSRYKWAEIELGNMHFDAETYQPKPFDDISNIDLLNPAVIYINILKPKEFINALQQMKIYDSELVIENTIYKCKINGNLELF